MRGRGTRPAALASRRNGIVAIVATTLLLLASGAPASSHDKGGHNEGNIEGGDHLDPHRQGLEFVGGHPLHGEGMNTDIWTQVTDDGRLFAYAGTWGTPIGAEGCPSETDDPSDPQRSGVKIVDATDPTAPEMVAVVGHTPGSQSNDIKVERLSTDAHDGHVMVHSLEPCGAMGLAAQLTGAPFTDVPVPQTGFEIYDVGDPADPQPLGTFNNGGIGTHNLYVYQQGDRAFVAAVFNEVSDAWPGTVRGVQQFVEITDPTDPTLVAEWSLEDAVDETGRELDELCQPRGVDSTFCFLHDVWVEHDPATDRWIAYLSYWDAGLVLLDVSDPEDPAYIGQFLDNPTEAGDYLDEEGNTHVAVPYHVDGRHLVMVGDEDFTGPGPAPFVTVEEAPDGAEVSAGDAMKGSEMTDTEPLDEAGVGPHLALLSDDGFGCSYVTAQGAAGGDDWIAVARRGGDACPTFAQKVAHAEAFGASALIIVNNEPGSTAGTAAGGIPAMMIDRDEGEALISSIDMTAPEVVVSMGLVELEDEINPWGFLRIVDVTDLDDDGSWEEVSTYKAPHVDTLDQPGGTFTAHNPLIGPDGRVYTAWYSAGVRVLEPGEGTGEFDEVGWYVMLGDEADGFPGGSPRGFFADNAGFWGSQAIEHPETGQLLVFSSDINNGIYILGYEQPDASPGPAADAGADPAPTPVTGGGPALLGLLVLAGAALVLRARRRATG